MKWLSNFEDKLTSMIAFSLIVGAIAWLTGSVEAATSRLTTITAWADTFGNLLGYILLGGLVLLPLGGLIAVVNWAYWYNRERKAEIGIIEAETMRKLFVSNVVTPQKSLAYYDLSRGIDGVSYHPLIEQLPDDTPAKLIAGSNVPVFYNDWWVDVIGTLKQDVDRYNSAMKVRIVGVDGSGKSVFINTFANQMIEPFPHADIQILDCEGDNDKWGVDVLADNITHYHTALRHAIEGMNKAEITTDNPSLVIVDEMDTYYQHDKNGSIANLNNLLKRGRKRGYWPIIIGQSPLVKESGISTKVNQLFNVVIYLGVSAVSGFLHYQTDWQDKKLWQDTLTEIAQRNDNHDKKFVGLCTFPNDPTIHEPFLFVLPILERQPLKPNLLNVGEVRKSILELPIAESVNPSLVKNDNSRFNRDLAILRRKRDKLVYRHNGKIITSSVCDILGFAHGGAKWDYAKQLADNL